MITVQFKLMPTSQQQNHLYQITKEYIDTVNDLVDYITAQDIMPKLTSARFQAKLPSSVKSEAILASQSICKKHKKGVCKSIPILKKPVCTWNNQNYQIKENSIEFPVLIDGKCKRISVKATMTEYQLKRLIGKLGTLRITQKSGKWIAQIAVHEAVVVCDGDTVMGIDLGLKIPAVAVTDTGKTKFFGNGRKNKYMKRKFRATRKKLGKAKKQKAINKLGNKEQRWMGDQDHKISRQIVNFAIQNQVSVIRLEQLQNIRNTARTSRKNAKNLHTWSFYRLAQYIEYKSNMVGIKVEYVNPKYTSQTCPLCGERNHAKDRKYVCSCGYHAHRDRVGAVNIIHAPVVSGNRKSA